MTTRGLYFRGTPGQEASFSVNAPMIVPAAGVAGRTLEFWFRAPLPERHFQSLIELQGSTSRGATAFTVLLHTQTRPDLKQVFDLSIREKIAGQSGQPQQVLTLPGDDQWHFVAFTSLNASHSPLHVYLDGKKQGEIDLDALKMQAFFTSISTCFIGGNPQESNEAFTGSMIGINIWNAARQDFQIQRNMTIPDSTPQSDLVACIPLDEGEGETFSVKQSITPIATGNLRGDVTWNTALETNPAPISEGIWFLIQNKADLATDSGIPARRLALTINSGEFIMDVVPAKGNYDRFLWRFVWSTHQLVNKQSNLTVSLNVNDLNNRSNWGTNAYFINDASNNRLSYNTQAEHVFSDPTNGNGNQRVWLLQPMEVMPGYGIPIPPRPNPAATPPVDDISPFTKMLTSEFGVTFYATNTTSEWAILNTHLVIRNIINAIQASYSPSTAFTGWRVLITSNYDTIPETVATYAMIKTLFSLDWIRTNWGGTGGGGTKIIWVTESMMCQKGIPYRQPADLGYREFEQVVHEFGHAIDMTILNSQASEQPEAKLLGDHKDEWFPWQVQYWFNSGHSNGAGLNRLSSVLSPAASTYLSGIFNTSNTWLPPRWLRDHQPEIFELLSGSFLTSGQTLSVHCNDKGSFELVLQADGNLVVYKDKTFKWGSKQNLGIASTQKAQMTDDGLLLLDASGKVLWRSMNIGHPGARLIVSSPEILDDNYLKIIDKDGNSVGLFSRKGPLGGLAEPRTPQGPQYNASSLLISGITVWSGFMVDALQLHYINRDGQKVKGLKYGGKGGGSREVTFAQNEYLIRIQIYSGKDLEVNAIGKMILFTSTGNRHEFGGGGNNMQDKGELKVDDPSHQKIDDLAVAFGQYINTLTIYYQ